MSRIDKSIETKCRLVVAIGWGEEGNGRYGISVWVDGNVPELVSCNSCTTLWIYYQPVRYIL